MTAVWVALLGAAGSLSRFALSSTVQRLAGPRWPLGTLAVNVLGSAAIGVVMAVYAARGELDGRARIALTAGFLGGFTTYSAFAHETIALLERRSVGAAAANVAVTTVVCLAACAAGAWLGRAVVR